MENKTVFVVTLKGEGEIKNHTHQLSEDVKRVLALVDDVATVEVLNRRAAPSLRGSLIETLRQLETGGYIRDQSKPAGGIMPKIAKPKTAAPPPPAETSDDLDFTSVLKVRTEAELKAAHDEETARHKAEQAAAAKVQLEAAKAKAEAEARVHAEAEAKAKREVEVARLKAEQATAKARAEAEAARIKAEQEAKKARDELEAARVEAERVRTELEAAKVEAEALAKREAETARLRKEAADATARAEAEIERIKAEREAALAEARTQQKAEAARIREEAEARARQEAEAILRKAEEEVAKARAEAEAMRLRAEEEAAQAKAEVIAKARQEAEAARLQAEQEAARAKAEAEEKARLEVEAARSKAEQEAAKVKAEAEEKARKEVEAVRSKAEQEAAKVKAEAEEKARKEVEAVRSKAEQEAAKVKAEAEAARTKAEQEALKARQEAEELAHQGAQASRLKAEQEIARVKAEAEEQIRLAAEAKISAESALAAKLKAEANAARSMIATVLFFDVVGYTRQPVAKQIELKKQFNQVAFELIKHIDESQRIILDTGDGAAIGFLQHPEDAIETALKFRDAVTSNNHLDFPDLKVRIGINLGPVNVVKDMNGQSNMVGDGINDAQRIMSFASSDQIYISRSYYDIVSRLSADYAKLFQYRGIKNDKHDRQHQVYEAVTGETTAPIPTAPDAAAKPATPAEETPFTIQVDPALLGSLGETTAAAAKPAPEPAAPPPTAQEEPEIVINLDLQAIESPAETARKEEQAAKEREKAKQAAEAERLKAEKETQQQAEAARLKAEKESAEARLKAEKEAAKAEQEARKLAEEQAKVWAAAEQRAQAQAETAAKTEQAAKAAPPPPSPRIQRKPLPIGKIVAGLLVLLLIAVGALPYIWPLQGYIAPVEQKLSAQLHQPVHIARMKAALLPLPKLELLDVSAGNAQELKAASVTLNFGMAALFADTKAIGTAEINELALDGAILPEAASWLQAAGGNPQYPVMRMTLNHAHISGLPVTSGSADMDGQGHFTAARLRSDDGKVDLELQHQQEQWKISLHLKENSLPWLPRLQFSELDVKGTAREDSADLTEIDGLLNGGKLSGDARLNWQGGWRMQGRVAARQMELQQALPQTGLEGTMDGDASFQAAGTSLLQPTGTLRLDGTFVVSKGIIGKMDLVETAAKHQAASGGRTHFDEMSGAILVENGNIRLRQVRIGSGAMNTTGSVDVEANGQLSGHLSVDLKMRPGSTPLSLSGTLDRPSLRP